MHRLGWFILAAAFVAGCSTANTGGGSGSGNHITPSGSSVPGWLSSPGPSLHSRTATSFFASQGNIDACAECHADDLSGGISRVSCLSNTAACHHGTVTGWVASGSATQQHGASAKRAPGASSMYACQICHGKDFRTPQGGVDCFTCHTRSPHPNKPWRSGGTDNTHVNVNAANAPVCFGCHADAASGNPNNPHRPPTPAAAGTAPGCFNGTMCHNSAAAPHITGTTWLDPLIGGAAFHGTSAKSDLGFCQECHGNPGTTNFNGGTASTSCSAACHPAAKAHPTDWQGVRTINGATITHRSAGNTAAACAICHKVDAAGTGPNPTAPSCFSASFTNSSPGATSRSCHSGGPGTTPHAVGSTWLDPAVGGSAFHGTEAKADLQFCQNCHGTPPRGFAGGSASTACTTCHTTADAHPTDWQGVRTISTATITHRTAGNRTAACGICHKVDAAGAGPNPTAPSCFSSSFTNGDNQARSCHATGPGQPNHPVPFFDNTAHTQTTTSTFTADCGNCHAVTGTSPLSGAPLCTTCHISDPRGVTNCTSCHANPPDGATTAFPNVAGAHATHLALNNATDPGTPVSCATCHSGLGSGTLSHYNRTRPPRSSPASVAFVTAYNAKSGAAGFDNSSLLRCTNVSCHGGQATPNWRTGTLTVETQCTSCHVFGTTQFNGPSSSNHDRAEHSSRACTVCHNATPLAVNHFTKLNSTALEGPASATISGTNITSYTPGSRSCTPTCHGTETW